MELNYSANNYDKHEIERVDVPIGRPIKKRQVLFIVLILVLTVGTTAFLIGHYVTSCRPASDQPANILAFHEKFQRSVRAENLENNLRYFSSQPHTVGSKRQKDLAQHLRDLWKGYGFDEVEMPEYRVLLSSAQKDKPNKVALIQNGTVEYEIIAQMNVTAGPKQSKSFLYTPYIAYSRNGTVEGELVYANQCSENDFKALAKHNISLEGKIVICRWIGAFVIKAAEYGAIGALLYPDPITRSKEGQEASNVFPNSPWSPEDAVFEKPLRHIYGDPLTPGLPSIPGMYRRPLNTTGLPGIPAQSISYKDAKYLLSRMKGDEVPVEWRGALNIPYKFGPGFSTKNTTVRLEIHNQLQIKSIYNVIGTIRGDIEPDRYVLIGNHRDAMLFGAVDPSSGTATLAEIARVVGSLVKTGWRPRRTIKFCSWGAEEFGLIGSVEWVEQHAQILSDRAIAYLNTDVAVGGNFVLVTQTCPMFVDFIFSWAKKIRDPNAHGDKSSVYDIMAERYPSAIKGEPHVVPFHFMSDYLPFYMTLGIPSADFSYFFGYKNKMELYPVYHTQYDNFYWMKELIDPKFEFHKTVAKLQGAMLLDLADTLLLNFNLSRTAASLKQLIPILKQYQDFNVAPIIEAIYKFGNASELFMKAKAKLTGKEDPLVLRMLNDQMLQVQKAFIRGMTFSPNPTVKIVASPRGYFPGVHEAYLRAKKTKNFEEVKKQLSIVAEAISSAADILKPLPLSSAGRMTQPGIVPGLLVLMACLLELYK